jgi:predicted MFS family arabinose efflux permease
MSSSEHDHVGGKPWTLAREKWLLLTLAAIQFTTVLDFMIIMPLGPQYMRVFHINPGQFGTMVSAYALSAGIAGLAAGFFLDWFDRRPALLWLYFGFAVGTLLCALAPTYRMLVAARVIAGAFGGVTGSLILAIIGDMIPDVRRGAAMGMVMSSFSVASVCGVPIGLRLANVFSWHTPFYALTGLSLVVLAATAVVLPSLQRHLKHNEGRQPVAFMLEVISQRNHQLAFLFMAALTMMSFFVFPYISPYMVSNVGVREADLDYIYAIGGLFTVFTMNWVGRWSDRYGKLRVFKAAALTTIVPIVVLTNLPKVPLVAAITVSTVFMICMSSRMPPGMAMITSSVEPRFRGSFMSINSSVQQFAAGLASFASGKIMGQTPTGEMTHFFYAGLVSVVFCAFCIVLANYLPASRKSDVGQPLVAEQSLGIGE